MVAEKDALKCKTTNVDVKKHVTVFTEIIGALDHNCYVDNLQKQCPYLVCVALTALLQNSRTVYVLNMLSHHPLYNIM